MRLLLSDEGEGWPSDAPSALAGDVIGTSPDKSDELLFMLRFDEPLERQLRSASSGWSVTTYVGAWVKRHLDGLPVSGQAPVPVYVWLVSQGSGWGDAPDGLPDLWARCEVLA